MRTVKKTAIISIILVFAFVFCGCISDVGTTSSNGGVSFTNSQKDKNESSKNTSSDTFSDTSSNTSSDISSDVSDNGSEISSDVSEAESGDVTGNTSSEISGGTSSDGAETSTDNGDTGNGDTGNGGTGNGGTENSTENGGGTGDNSSSESESTPPPVIDEDYIENPTSADIEVFYKFIHDKIENYNTPGIYWSEKDDINFSNYDDTLSLACAYYRYFGFELDHLPNQGQGCGDPLGRFMFTDEEYNDPFAIDLSVTATIYDVEVLNWICENIFNGTAKYLDDKYGYCCDGKYYEARYYYGGYGDYPGNSLYKYERSYTYLGNGQYRFTFYYEVDEAGVGFATTMQFIAIPKYDEKMGTYWKLISYDRVNRQRIDIS